MTSLRRRLFAILVAATGLIWLCGILWLFLGAKAELEHVLDARLQEAARMVDSLVAKSGPSFADAANAVARPEHYERQLSCQIWSLDGRLIARSASAPGVSLGDRTAGFSDRRILGETWRVYTIENPGKGVRVMIGDRLGQRDQLVTDLVKGLFIPALVMLPVLGGLIWLSLGRGLRPLFDMAVELESREADDMRPLGTRNAPAELRPLAAALNGLFAKVETARRHERDVTAFAAHELRTPLAGLKTHAQIAMATDDPDVRQGALRHIVLSVDRATRLVRQLLTLAKLESGLDTGQTARLAIGAVIEEIAQPSPPSDRAVTIRVAPALRGLTVTANRESLGIALRNLHENALQHSPQGGTITWDVLPDGDGVFVEDEGPGIPPDEIPLATRRFFRGKRQTPTGCGLGLAIVEAVLQQMGGRLVLENQEQGHGLRAMAVLSPGKGQPATAASRTRPKAPKEP